MLCASTLSVAYDPMAVPDNFEPKTFDLTITDTARSRQIPIRVFLPNTDKPAPVILYSHGLGGSRENNPYLGNHWSARGYAAVFIQHPGSDESVWKDIPASQRLTDMTKAANAQNFFLRVKDIPAVLDALEKLNKDKNNDLFNRFDMNKVGMSGYSFGAVTAQAVSGQSSARGTNTLNDSRIKAAVIMSPSFPRYGRKQTAFDNVKIPWLLLTGTKDTTQIMPDVTVESRLKVFPALPPGGKYEVVLYNAEHSVFSDRALPGDKEQRNPNHHKVILSMTTSFWDTYLKDDTDAKQWLDGLGPGSILEPKDTFRKK